MNGSDVTSSAPPPWKSASWPNSLTNHFANRFSLARPTWPKRCAALGSMWQRFGAPSRGAAGLKLPGVPPRFGPAVLDRELFSIKQLIAGT